MLVELVGADTAAKAHVAAIVRCAIDAFVALGVKRIEDVCNARRLWLLETLSAEMLTRRGLPGFPLEGARNELAPPFALTPRDRVLLQFGCNVWVGKESTPMAADPEGTFWVFIDAIDVEKRAARDSCMSGMSLEAIAFHELLHLSGDWKPDGVLRQNWAGGEAIERALAGLAPQG